MVERERGFAYQEDLFQPGQFEIRLVPGKPVFLTASTEALQTEHGHNVIGEIWRREVERRMGLALSLIHISCFFVPIAFASGRRRASGRSGAAWRG